MLIATETVTLFEWLEASSLAVYFRQSLWLYPIVEIVHIAGFAVLVGAAVLFDLRLLGLSGKLPVTDCIDHLIFWARISFLAVLPSGLILFIVDAVSMISNPAFQIKLVLIGFAILNAMIFHHFTIKSVHRWNVGRLTPPAAKLAGVISMLLWFGVIACGRLIAYI
jgi:hypothetical protein